MTLLLIGVSVVSALTYDQMARYPDDNQGESVTLNGRWYSQIIHHRMDGTSSTASNRNTYSSVQYLKYILWSTVEILGRTSGNRTKEVCYRMGAV
jgi:hypothetical protein